MDQAVDEAVADDVPSVRELIRARLAGGRDPYTLGLSVEGGGMRGVVSGAMLIALRELGVTDVVDRFYGTSSGSINLAYFASGGGWDALSVYYDHLVDGFVLPRRLPHRPRLDMGYVFDEVMRRRVPLDTARLADSPYDVRIVLSDVELAQPRIVALRPVAGRAHDYLRAGAWLPILAGPPELLDGRRYLDGGLLWPDPLYAALQERCTHILMINTAPQDAGNNTSRLTAEVLRRVLDRWQPGLGRAYLGGRAPWAADKALLHNTQDVPLRGSRVLRICPGPGSHRVQRLTMERADLLDGTRTGYATVMAAFDRPRSGSYFAVVG